MISINAKVNSLFLNLFYKLAILLTTAITTEEKCFFPVPFCFYNIFTISFHFTRK